MSNYYLFSTEHCHLCEQAEQVIDRSSLSIDYQKKEITDNTAWLERYSIRIPVLYHKNSGAELNWPFDVDALQEFVVKLHS